MTAPRDPRDATPATAWSRISRRGLLKALVSLPVLGGFVVGVLKKQALDDARKRALLEELGVSEGAPAVIPGAISRPPGRVVRVGVIGFGGEGESLTRHAGFAHPDWIAESRKAVEEDPRNANLKTYLEQEDLNVAITAVCDVFDVRAERGVAASSVDVRPRGAAAMPPARRYRRYKQRHPRSDGHDPDAPPACRTLPGCGGRGL